VTSIDAARKLSSEAVITANAKQVGAADYGVFTFGPVVDGSFIPALPALLLGQGVFAKNVKVMVGHNADEGPLFTPPFTTDDTALFAFFRQLYPNIDMSVTRYIVKTLYPVVYDGTYPYTSSLSRTVFIISESIFSCNTNYLDRAFGNSAYAYEFSVPPALHGLDVSYTFYNGVAGEEQAVDKVAKAMQQYITNFAQTGTPNGAGVPAFDMYGTSANEENLNVTGFKLMKDPTAHARCLWWQKALYY
jgi:carboxylesterase type B